jgi:hypothetical protein
MGLPVRLNKLVELFPRKLALVLPGSDEESSKCLSALQTIKALDPGMFRR